MRDEKVGGLDISVDNVVIVHILQPLEQLLHVEFDVRRLELDCRVLEESSKVMVHVWEDHLYRASYIGFP